MNKDHESAALETLRAFAREWSDKLKVNPTMEVSVGVGVTISNGKIFTVSSARIGDVTEPFSWKTYTHDGIGAAILETERKWRGDGSPTDPKKVDEAKAVARVKELGYEVTKTIN